MKRLLGFLTSLMLCAAVVPLVALPPDTAQAAQFGSDWKALTDESTTLTSGKYYLDKDISPVDPSTGMPTEISVSGTVTIDLNGHNIAFNWFQAPDKSTCIMVGTRANLTLQDSEGGGTVRNGGGHFGGVSSSSSYGGGVYLSPGATFTFTGGTIHECQASCGGGVYMFLNSTFNLAGGTIDDCTATSVGGGVYAPYGGAIRISSGSITDCSALGSNSRGAGIYISDTTLKMTGGTISGCNGEAVSISADTTMDASGGRIEGVVYSSSGIITRTATGTDASSYTYFGGDVNAIGEYRIDDVAKVSVSFDAAGGSPTPATQKVLRGQKVSQPGAPAKDGWVFDGWFAQDSSSAFDFDSRIDGNTTFVARWTHDTQEPTQEPRDIRNAVVSLEPDYFVYDGREKAPSVSVTYQSQPLVEGRDYYLAGDVAATDPGTYYITVEGLGDYAGTETEEAMWFIQRASQEVRAADVHATYGDTGAAIAATGIGALTYEVTAGDDVVSVDASTGALTIHRAGDATVTVTAEGDENHEPASANVAVTVAKAAPVVSEWPAIADVFVNDELDDAGLAGGAADVDGSFSIEGAPMSWPSAGEQQVTVTFAPQDADNYLSVKREVPVNVVKRVASGVVDETPGIAGKLQGTPLGELGLPAAVTIQTEDGKAFEVPVSWEGYDPESLELQELVGVLDLSAVSDEVEQPEPAVFAAVQVTLDEPEAEEPEDDGDGAGTKAPAKKQAAKSSGTSGTAGTPATGDDAGAALPAVLLALAGAAFAALAALRCRRGEAGVRG